MAFPFHGRNSSYLLGIFIGYESGIFSHIDHFRALSIQPDGIWQRAGQGLIRKAPTTMDWSNQPGQSCLETLLLGSMASRDMLSTASHMFNQTLLWNLPTTSTFREFSALEALQPTPQAEAATSRPPWCMLISGNTLRLCSKIGKTPCSHGTLMAIHSLWWGKIMHIVWIFL